MNYGESWRVAGCGWDKTDLGPKEPLHSLPPTIPFSTPFLCLSHLPLGLLFFPPATC